MTFAEIMVMKRFERNWNQGDLAKKVGCNQGSIALWESGTSPSLHFAIRVARVLDFKLDDLDPDQGARANKERLRMQRRIYKLKEELRLLEAKVSVEPTRLPAPGQLVHNVLQTVDKIGAV